MSLLANLFFFVYLICIALLLLCVLLFVVKGLLFRTIPSCAWVGVLFRFRSITRLPACVQTSFEGFDLMRIGKARRGEAFSFVCM